jgi:carbamoyl-phosphate synthase large subunit
MTMPTVLVTGVGGPAGVAVVRSLLPRTTVIGVDADAGAVWLSLAHKGLVLPQSSDAGYVDALCDVAAATETRVLVSTVAEEMVCLHRARTRLAAAGVALWVPPPAAVRRCVDKWAFHRVALRTPGVPTPPTALGSADEVPGPWLVKPRFGRGSRDVWPADDLDELRIAVRRVPDPIVQQRVAGREFTVDVLVDHAGTLAAAVPRWRLQTRGGISVQGRTFYSRQLERATQRLVRALGLSGAANVQGFVERDSHVVFIEVNPRFSGGLPLTLAAGADLVGEFVRGTVTGRFDASRLQWRPDVSMSRYFEDVFVG